MFCINLNMLIVYMTWGTLDTQQEGNADHALKTDFYIFLLIFQHKWMFLSTMQTLPFEGHNVAYISVKVLTKATLCVSMK